MTINSLITMQMAQINAETPLLEPFLCIMAMCVVFAIIGWIQTDKLANLRGYVDWMERRIIKDEVTK